MIYVNHFHLYSEWLNHSEKISMWKCNIRRNFCLSKQGCHDMCIYKDSRDSQIYIDSTSIRRIDIQSTSIRGSLLSATWLAPCNDMIMKVNPIPSCLHISKCSRSNGWPSYLMDSLVASWHHAIWTSMNIDYSSWTDSLHLILILISCQMYSLEIPDAQHMVYTLVMQSRMYKS